MVTRIIHSQLHNIYPASLCHKEKNCLLTDIWLWLVLTAWKNKNFQVSKCHPGRQKRPFCGMYLILTIVPNDSAGSMWHPLVYLPYFLVVAVGSLRKKLRFPRLADPMWHLTQKLSSVTKYQLLQKLSPMKSTPLKYRKNTPTQ